jgi:hypothetical protein
VSIHRAAHEFDVVVIGGGMAGLCAAIASARNGAKTALVHDRPVLGGNASSEIRMHICGAHGRHNKETGILEEIQLENCYRNPSLNYSIWDSVLYGVAFHQPGLSTFLNATCVGAAMGASASQSRICAIEAWQLTSQTMHTLRAELFIDCSGDSVLAALTPAQWRSGREAREEFDEDIEPITADAKTMGSSCLIQFRRTDSPQTFVPPRWAYKFTRPEDLPCRIDGVNAHNFWWMELGGLADTIKDAEAVRDHLQRVAYGVWDYIKNYSPARAEAENWALEWVGALPGKRESRRYVGDHTLTQNDVRAGGHFADTIAYGGWSMDDHHPAGLLYRGQPTIYHAAPSPYGIPFRCLYSRNVANLLFAGRNISVTHAALSSTRVMGTCAILGQAAGTAAALCIRHRCSPRELYGSHIAQLQQTLMEDDCFLPGLVRPICALAKAAAVTGEGEALPRLLDGVDRDRESESHAAAVPLGSPVTFRWSTEVPIAGVRLVFDSDLSDPKRMPYTYPQPGNRCLVPKTLVKRFRLDVLDGAGNWKTFSRTEGNYQRLVCIPLEVRTIGLRFVAEETWGAGIAPLFACEPLDVLRQKVPALPEGPCFSSLVAAADPRDLAAPHSA